MSIEERIFELLEATGTNWTADKRPTFDAQGNPSGHYGIYRRDNDKPIGAVGERYVVMQNAELAENIVKASDGISVDFKGGIFKGGSRVYYQGKLEDEHVGPDTVKRNLTIMNSHDGSSSIGFGFANTVVSCSNSFYRALRELDKFRHTSTAEERLRMAREEIINTLTVEKGLIENYKRMAEAPIQEKVKRKVVADLFNLKVEDLTSSVENFSTRKQNKMSEFGTAMAKELAQKGETLWGLFNAVTYKTNHLDTAKDKALESVMLGAGARKNLKAYNTIVDSLPKAYSLS